MSIIDETQKLDNNGESREKWSNIKESLRKSKSIAAKESEEYGAQQREMSLAEADAYMSCSNKDVTLRMSKSIKDKFMQYAENENIDFTKAFEKILYGWVNANNNLMVSAENFNNPSRMIEHNEKTEDLEIHLGNLNKDEWILFNDIFKDVESLEKQQSIGGHVADRKNTSEKVCRMILSDYAEGKVTPMDAQKFNEDHWGERGKLSDDMQDVYYTTPDLQARDVPKSLGGR